jgi:hypothetical protein
LRPRAEILFIDGGFPSDACRPLPMSAYAFLTRLSRRAYALIFRRHVSLQVAEGGVRVTLQDRPAALNRDRPPTRAELAARKAQQEFHLMQQQLTELLNELPETRSTLRHLVVVERAMERKGLRALESLPVELLRRALDQLEGMVMNWSPTGLAALRSRIAVLIIERDKPLASAEVEPEAEAEAEAYRTATLLDALSSQDAEGELDARTDDALAAAYAALGDLAPGAVEVQGDLGSSSAKAVSRQGTQAAAAATS